MKKQILTQVAAVAVLAMLSFAVTPSVSAAPSSSRSSSASLASSDAPLSHSAPSTHAFLRDSRRLAELARDLMVSSTDRTATSTPYGQRVIYHLSGHVDIAFTYARGGEALVDPAAKDGLGASLVAVGADPFPYISLDSSEQAAGAAGAAGTIAFAVCAAVGPETAGIGCGIGAGLGATVIGILTAHGVCPDGQNLRIYLATLAVQCRHD